MNDPGRTPAPTLEPTALAAFLVALILGWCPLTGLAAIALGITALLRIHERRGARTGRGLALGGIGIAAALLVGSGVLLDRLSGEVWDSMDAQATTAIDAGLGGPARVRHAGTRPTLRPSRRRRRSRRARWRRLARCAR